MIFVKELKIKNFKSIEDQTVTLNKGLNIVVGPNNAGKTNIIEAIDLLLGDVYLPNFEATTDHFFSGDNSREILIEAVLEGDAEELRDIFSEANQQIEVRFRYSKNDGGSFEVKSNNTWGRKYNKPFGYYWDFDKKLFFLRVKSLRNLMEISPVRWKSPLKYFKEIIVKKAPKEQLDEVLKGINNSKDKLSEINEVKNLISDLLRISKDQTDVKNIYLSPSSTSYSDILNEMKIIIDDGYVSEVTKKGLGTQNLTIISLFRVMAKYIRDDEKKSIIYGIDEPEIGLHPHAQRHLLKSLEKLADYSQVIITTHSSNLVDIYKIENVIRVDRNNGRTVTHQTTLSEQQKKVLEIHGDNTEELFFCKRALVVEGKTETGFFAEASKKVIETIDQGNGSTIDKHHSFDINSVSVINGQGDTIWHFVKLIRTFHIPFILLIDSDKLSQSLEKCKEVGMITQEDYARLIALSDDAERKSELKRFNIWVCDIFETALCTNAEEAVLRKIIDSINFVKRNWGYANGIQDFASTTDINVLRGEVINYMSTNKRRRIGHAIAHSLESTEYPADYIEIIKTVTGL